MRPISRLSGVVSVLPFVGYPRVAENEFDQLGEASFRANIVRENHHAALAGFEADHRVRSLSVVPAFVEAVPLRSVEDNHTESGVQIFALFVDRERPAWNIGN